MGTPYIYYINSRDKGGTYIGQSKGSESSFNRIVSHFSGLYHYNKDGRYINTRENSIGEGALFVDWLRTVPLNTIVTRVFYGPDYGIPKQIWIEFLSQWSPSRYHRFLDGQTKAEQEEKAWAAFLAMSDEAKLNAAEIIHIYNAKKRGYTLLQRQMGGQNLNLFKRGSNIVLNREMSPAQMVSVIDADEGKMKDLQATFDKYFQKDVLQNPKFINSLIQDSTLITALINQPNAAYKRLLTLVDQFLQSSAYGNTTVFEMLINAVKDECSHSQYFRISWGQKDDKALSVYEQGRNQNYKTFISAISNQIVRACKELSTTSDHFAQDFEKMLKSALKPIYVSVGSMIDIKLLVSYNGLDSFTPLGEAVDISSSLKRISYFYYAHFADMYYSQHSFEINDSHKYFDSEFNYFAKMKGETCTAFVYNKYREEGISTPYMDNWSTWRQFNNGMLTIYTKNRGNAFLGNTQPDPRILQEDESNNHFINTYAFIFDTELPFVEGIPFYEVSPTTWAFVVSGSGLDIENLKHY